MRSNRLIPAVAIVGLTILPTNTPALEPGTEFSKIFHPTGVIPLPESPQDVTANQVVCTNDAECDDGLFCTGTETCNLATGFCRRGTGNPCRTFEGYLAPCDDFSASCTQPDPCFTWIVGAGSGFFFPEANHCPDLASWVLDDVQGSHHTTGVLDFYTTPLLARSTPIGASPLGTIFSVDQALFTVEPLTCFPQAEIAGSQCTGTATVDPGGSPAHDLPCSGTMPALPNNAGDFNRCEIDFFMAYRTTENGAGFLGAPQKPLLGGPAVFDDIGLRIFWLEDCPPTGAFFWVIPTDDDPSWPGDFATAVVCQKPGATCCEDDGSCAIVPPNECGGIAGEVGTVATGPASCGSDPDEDGILAVCDNCPDDFNPDQGDCDGDGEGNACETDPREQDDDGDGVCNFVDNCRFIPNPGQEDTDGDGTGDPCDPCPIDPNDDSDGDGVCDSDDQCSGGDDRLDDDSDGVPDDCDVCPGSDDNVPGVQDDADGDGALNCNDKCNGVDDTVFAPECDGAIPTTSHWGLIVLTLLLLAGGKTFFGRDAKRVARS